MKPQSVEAALFLPRYDKGKKITQGEKDDEDKIWNQTNNGHDEAW